MDEKRTNKTMSKEVQVKYKKKVTLSGKSSVDLSVSTKRNKVWNGDLTPSFLKDATKAILLFNQEREISVIYAKEGIIYKESKSGKVKLGKITKLKRQIKENHYTIEHVKISE